MDRVIGRRIRVRGQVQGVGFRPHVWRLAAVHGLRGHVCNDGAGVVIEAWGSGEALPAFLTDLEKHAPPLARITGIAATQLHGDPPRQGFAIAASGEGKPASVIVPDAATCPACLGEVFDRRNRRSGYAFTNCTHCGPRLSIVRSIPYDRANTAMAVFSMCRRCTDEYENPVDRRFHAQPNACPDCGPRLWLEKAGARRSVGDPVKEAARLVAGGAIVAVKGIGGFHLACDATDDAAVEALRRRKQRFAKPFAVMVRDVEQARRFCRIGPEQQDLLQMSAAPIVLLTQQGEPLARSIAPGQDHIGMMLPYTPLHHMLLASLDRPLVMTSANRSDEPQVTDNGEARERLAGIADAWLMHDRGIVNRLDDTVMRFDRPGPQVLRRGRGLVPAPLSLADGFAVAPPILAMGGELKSAFCLMRDGEAILSQHMGDLEQSAVRDDFRRNLALYRDLYRFGPAAIAVDQHPDYASTMDGRNLADLTGAQVVCVQHHHAHFAAVLAEHGVERDNDASLGIILDGLGYGSDGTAWGGELLTGGYRDFRRVAHFTSVAMPGGAQAVREPWRNLVAHLRAAFGDDWRAETAGTTLDAWLASKPLGLVGQMIERGVNAPLSSSAGRLFDAVAASLGVCADSQRYEGQAAMELEALARPHFAAAGRYPAAFSTGDPAILSWQPLWRSLVEDLRNGVGPGMVAARFHNGLAQALAGCADRLMAERSLKRIVLSGGVMQNAILLETLFAELTARGHTVLVPRHAPANDGGLALGQCAVAAAKID